MCTCSCTEEYTLLHYAFCDLSHFVIMAVTAQTESNNTENVFWVLGRVPMFHFWHEYEKLYFCPFWCYFTGIYVYVYVYQLIIDVPRKPSWKGPILMWACFLHLGVHPRLLWNLSEQLCFEPSQIATVTNCDNSGIPAVAICDLSQFVIKAVTAQTESNNIENVFCVLGRVPMITFDRNLWDWVLTHFRIICYMYCV